MGMFSWKCKGCGHELIQGEDVRLNGSRQIYDGYGGTAADSENYEPSAWHNRCYKRASKDERLDESPSASAPDQGFGQMKLEFVEGYDETKPIKYSVVVFTGYYVDGKSGKFEFFYTNDNKLEDDIEYRERYDAACELHPMPEMEDWNAWRLLSEERKKKAYEDHALAIETALGGPSPRRNEKDFQSIEEAIAAIDALLPGCLPEIVDGTYDLVVFGKQDEIEGAVYERTANHRYDRSTRDWVKLEGLEVKEVFRIGNPAESNVKDKLALAVNRFLEIEKEYEDASAALGRAVEPVMNSTNDVEKLIELADSLPKKWRGNRRIFEQILHLQGTQE